MLLRGRGVTATAKEMLNNRVNSCDSGGSNNDGDGGGGGGDPEDEGESTSWPYVARSRVRVRSRITIKQNSNLKKKLNFLGKSVSGRKSIL